MWNRLLLPLIALLPLLTVSKALALPQNILEQPALSQPTTKQPQTIRLAQEPETADSAEEQQKLVGTVYSVVGDIVMIRLENGKTKHVAIPRSQRGQLGELVGKRVAIYTDSSGQRISLAPLPAPVAVEASKVSEVYQSIEEREVTQRELAVPPAQPAPQPLQRVEPQQPVEQPVPKIIPQTW